MAAQDFENWLDSTNYDEYPMFAVEGMRAAWFAAEEKFNSAPSANQQLKAAIALVREHGSVVLSEGYPREQLDTYLTIIEQRAAV